MELNKDCIKILQYLIERNDYVDINELAYEYKVTNRAIRYRLDHIEKFLVINGFNYLDKKYKKGVKIESSDRLKDFIRNFSKEYTPYKYKYSKEERFVYILFKLLQENKPVNLKHFEENLCVSRNTLLKELDSIELWLKDKNLNLIRKTKVGLLIYGDELIKRNLSCKIFFKTASSEDILNYISNKIIKSKINKLQFDIVFSNIDITFINELIKSAEVELKKEFSDESYTYLIIQLSIMIKRIQLNQNININNVNEDFITKTKEYTVSKNIINKIENYYNIKISEDEIKYIVIHLLSSKIINEHIIDESYKESDLYNVIDKMTSCIESFYNINFGEERDSLNNGLILHLKPLIYRIKYENKLVNPLFDYIKIKHKELFNYVKISIKYLEDLIGSNVGEHEISYIVIHYAAAIRQYNEKRNKKSKIILVCGTGIGTSKMVSSSILEKFYVDIIGTYASRNISRDVLNECDYIVSTIDIQSLSKDEYIKINPILTEKDYSKLESYLTRNIRENTKLNEIDLVNRLLNVVKKHCHITDEEQLKCEFLYEIKKESENKPKTNEKLSLINFINKQNIRLNLNCKNFEDVILQGTKPLEEQGLITPKYGIDIINKLKEYGPYMVIAPGVCLSHTNLVNEINKSCMSFISLKNPIKFNSEFNDPVKIVLTFASLDKEIHLNALLEFMNILNNPKHLDRLKNTSSTEEVLDIFSKYTY